MPQGTVRIRGLRETQRAFNKLDKSVAKEVRDELKKVAEPVAALARQKLSGIPGAKLGTIGPKTSRSSVFVTQRARKVTGLRPDYGGLQMRRGLLPALAEREDEIVEGVEDALDRLIRSEGF